MNKSLRPDIYLFDSSTKGLSLLDPEAWDAFNINGDGERARKRTGISLEQAYTHEAWTKRCVDVRAKTVASLPWRIDTLSGTTVATHEDELPDDLAFLDLDDYLFRATASLALTGLAPAQIEGEHRRRDFVITRPTGLLWISPDKIEQVTTQGGEYGTDANGRVRYWKRTVGGRSMYLPVQWVLSVMAPSPFVEQGYYQSDAIAAKASSQILHDLSVYTSDQLRSGLPKKTIFIASKDAPKNPSEETVKKLERFIHRWLSGTKNTPPKIVQGIDTKEIGSNLADLHSEAITKDAREDVATALGVPHSVVMSNAANFATAEKDMLNFLTTTAIPDANLLAKRLNEKVMAPLGYRLVFEPAKHEAFQNSELQKAMSVSVAVGAPVLTVNEGRELLGFDPIEGQDAQPEPEESKALDLQRWQTKASRKGRNVAFSPDALTEHEESVIRERLANEHVPLKDAFRPPFVGF